MMRALQTYVCMYVCPTVKFEPDDRFSWKFMWKSDTTEHYMLIILNFISSILLIWRPYESDTSSTLCKVLKCRLLRDLGKEHGTFIKTIFM